MVKVGDIVLIHDDTPRVQWKLVVVEQVNREADGHIRSAMFVRQQGEQIKTVSIGNYCYRNA